MRTTIEVVDSQTMMCFEVDARTLEPLTCSYYEPAAIRDPRSPQMGFNEWSIKHMDLVCKAYKK